MIKDPRVVVVSPEVPSPPPAEPVLEVEFEFFSAAIKGSAASDVAGDLQLIAKNETKQMKIPKKMPHFFIASSPLNEILNNFFHKSNML